MKRIFTFAALAVVFGLGAYIRFVDIGKHSFWNDELFHVFAARSLIQDDTLEVPFFGGDYERSLPTTYLTAAAFSLFGMSEAAGRAPFAVVNLLFIVAAAMLVRRLFGSIPALLFGFVMLFSPFMVETARETRMYGLFQPLYFFGSILLFLGFEPGPRRFEMPHRGVPGPTRLVSAAPLLAGTAFLLASLSVHKLTVNIGLVFGAYVVIMAVTEAVRGKRAVFRSKYLAITVVGVVAVAVLAAVRPSIFPEFLAMATDVPAWAGYRRADFHFYRHFLSAEYPALFFIYPVAAYFAVRRYGRLGLFIVLNFALLFILHSVFFGRKEERYIFYIFPFFLLPPVLFFAEIANRCRPTVRAFFLKRRPVARLGLVLLALPAINVVAFPWLGNSKNVARRSRQVDWRSAPTALNDLADRPVYTTNPKSFLYYIGRYPTLWINSEPDSSRSYENGMIDSQDEIERFVRDVENAAIVTERGMFHRSFYFRPSLRALIQAEMVPVPHGGDDRLMIFVRASEMNVDGEVP